MAVNDKQLRRKNEWIRLKIMEIAEGRGPFSRDQLTHATNTVEAMKELAREALAGPLIDWDGPVRETTMIDENPSGEVPGAWPTAVRAGRGREVTARKKNAKARLLEYVGGDGSVDYMGEDARKHTRKVCRLVAALLRERAEVAEKACRSADKGADTATRLLCFRCGRLAYAAVLRGR